jgi:nucleotide-binding universal stress UspA family protein
MSLNAIKSIFLPFSAQADGSISPYSQYALSLAAQAGATITARSYGMIFDPPMALSAGFVGGIVGTANANEKQRMDKALDAVKTAANTGGVQFQGATMQDNLASIQADVSALGRLHDVTILESAEGYLATGHALIEEALFHSGRPIIVAPSDGRDFKVKHIVIAWDASSRAARAVQDAMPFLRSAVSVDILCVTNEKELKRSLPGAELAPFLQRHAINANVVELTPPDKDAAKAIRQHLEASKADMLVMGGYARSFLRQLIWGGVTETMLAAPPTAVLMSH